jgi:large subunit ribosomal protein L4
MPKKAKKMALRSALSLRASEGKIVVLDAFATDGKTTSVATALTAIAPDAKVLVVDAKDNGNLARGSRNLAWSQWIAPEGVNVYDILRHDTLVLTQAAVKSIEAALKPAGDGE